MIRRHLIPAFVISLAAAGGIAAAAAAAPVRPPCTARTPACLKRVARTYIDALVSHDGGRIPLAAGVRRTENALTNARGAYEVRESFARTRMVERARDIRMWADPVSGDVIAFFLLDVDLKAADATATTRSGNSDYKVAVTVPQGTYTVHEAERFRIVGGYITQIEILAHPEAGKGQGSGWPVPRDAQVGEAR